MKIAVLAAILALGPVCASAQTITITQQTCAQLTRHVPAANVEYKPGVDVVNGKKVVPADLSATQIKVSENFDIAITVELAHRFGIPAFPDPNNPQRDLYKPEANIGTVSYRNGRAYFNDQPLQDDGEAALAELCQRVRPR